MSPHSRKPKRTRTACGVLTPPQNPRPYSSPTKWKVAHTTRAILVYRKKIARKVDSRAMSAIKSIDAPVCLYTYSALSADRMKWRVLELCIHVWLSRPIYRANLLPRGESCHRRKIILASPAPVNWMVFYGVYIVCCIRAVCHKMQGLRSEWGALGRDAALKWLCVFVCLWMSCGAVHSVCADL